MSSQTAVSQNTYQDKISPLAFTMWFFAASFYFYQFILRVLPNSITDELMRDLHLTAGTAGLLFSWYYWGYAAFQIPAGVLIDRFGVRYPLGTAAALGGLGCVFFFVSDSSLLMSIGRCFMGIGSAFGFLSAVKILQTRFPVRYLTVFMGLTIALGTAGGAGGGSLLTHLKETHTWQELVQYLAVFGLVISGVIFFIVKDSGKNRAVHHEAEDEEETSVMGAIKLIVKNPQTWFIGLYGSLMYVPLSGFADMWGTQFMMKFYGVEKTIANGAVMTFYVGLGCGAPFNAFLADLFRSHRLVMKVSAIFTGLIFLPIIFIKMPFWMTYVVLFFAGLVAAGQLIAFVTVLSVNQKSAGATASGFHNMLCMISGVIFQPLLGYIIDFFWSGATDSFGQPVYSLSDYQNAMAALPIVALVSLGLTFVIRESYESEEV